MMTGHSGRHTVRLFVEQALWGGACVLLTPDQQHRLCHVMRLGVGAVVAVFNGRDGVWLADVCTDEQEGDGKKRRSKNMAFFLRCHGACLQVQSAVCAPVRLAFCLIKQQEWLLEKAVELGVTELFPLISQYTVVRHVGGLERWKKTILQACEQSRRMDVPTLYPVQSVHAFCAHMGAQNGNNQHGVDLKSHNHHKKKDAHIQPQQFFLEKGCGDISLQSSHFGPEDISSGMHGAAYDLGTKPYASHCPTAFQSLGATSRARWCVLDEACAGQENPSGILKGAGGIVVGPEGGWHPEERQCFVDCGWPLVGLGAGILRAETAVVAGLALLRWGVLS